MSLRRNLESLIDKTQFIDTHEHLCEESFRVEMVGKGPYSELVPSDFMMLFHAYAYSDLIAAGMPEASASDLLLSSKSPKDKWRILKPYYEDARHTGYHQAIRATLRALLGEDDLCEDNCESVSQRLIDGIQPGYYRRVLCDVAGIEYAQVNAIRFTGKNVSSMPILGDTQYPELLAQDITMLPLATGPDVKGLSKEFERDIASLEDWHALIDWVFDTHGPRAIAIKSQIAYLRRLDFEQVSAADAAPLFARYVKDATAVSAADLKAIQDHLFHYCVDKAAEYNLPVKLHTGYYASQNTMPLERVRKNMSDLCPILMAHPKTRFVLMHMTYPYEYELISICKHYANAYADMCWAWIINPLAGVRFVKEYLMAAPANKLLTFGGDYFCVESVPGHAAVARKGLTQALSELVEEGWLRDDEAGALVPRLMNGNARALFDQERALRNWRRKPDTAPRDSSLSFA